MRNAELKARLLKEHGNLLKGIKAAEGNLKKLRRALRVIERQLAETDRKQASLN